MTTTRLAGVALAIIDAVFVWWGLSATAADYGSDYAVNPAGRLLVLILGGAMGVAALILVVGPGRSVAFRD